MTVEELGEVEILLVEDNDADAELTLHAFRKYHFTNKIHWVKDGVEAIDFLLGKESTSERLQRLKLILTDLRMPRIDGIGLLKRLRADERTNHLRVVVLTDSTDERSFVESHHLGITGYLLKPVHFGAFAESAALLGLYWVLASKG